MRLAGPRNHPDDLDVLTRNVQAGVKVVVNAEEGTAAPGAQFSYQPLVIYTANDKLATFSLYRFVYHDDTSLHHPKVPHLIVINLKVKRIGRIIDQARGRCILR